MIVDLPSGRRFTDDPEDDTCPPGIRNADRADASVLREVCGIVAAVVSFGRFNTGVVADVEKRGIGVSVSVSVFVDDRYESSAINETLSPCTLRAQVPRLIEDKNSIYLYVNNLWEVLNEFEVDSDGEIFNCEYTTGIK